MKVPQSPCLKYNVRPGSPSPHPHGLLNLPSNNKSMPVGNWKASPLLHLHLQQQQLLNYPTPFSNQTILIFHSTPAFLPFPGWAFSLLGDELVMPASTSRLGEFSSLKGHAPEPFKKLEEEFSIWYFNKGGWSHRVLPSERWSGSLVSKQWPPVLGGLAAGGVSSHIVHKLFICIVWELKLHGFIKLRSCQTTFYQEKLKRALMYIFCGWLTLIFSVSKSFHKGSVYCTTFYEVPWSIPP